MRPLVLVLSTLSLAACFKPTAPPSYEFEPLPSPVSASNPQCPDLSGTYRLVPGSRESRLFSPYLLPPHQMDMVQLTRNSNDWFSYRVKMDESRFAGEASALRSSNPSGYAIWRELISQWQQEKREKKETSVIEGKILQVGPLPERGGLLTPSMCEAFWGMVNYQDGEPVGLDGDIDNPGAVETETRLSRGKRGALLFRYDNYRTRGFIFGSTVRTGIINSAYAKLEPMQHSLFDWEVGGSTAPQPQVLPGSFEQQVKPEAALSGSAVELPANLPAVLVDVQQYAMGQLPAGASITHFLLDESSQNGKLWISMKGETNSNKEVSDLLRAMMQHPHVGNVELVSVLYSDNHKIKFDIRLQLKDRPQAR